MILSGVQYLAPMDPERPVQEVLAPPDEHTTRRQREHIHTLTISGPRSASTGRAAPLAGVDWLRGRIRFKQAFCFGIVEDERLDFVVGRAGIEPAIM